MWLYWDSVKRHHHEGRISNECTGLWTFLLIYKHHKRVHTWFTELIDVRNFYLLWYSYAMKLLIKLKIFPTVTRRLWSIARIPFSLHKSLYLEKTRHNKNLQVVIYLFTQRKRSSFFNHKLWKHRKLIELNYTFEFQRMVSVFENW